MVKRYFKVYIDYQNYISIDETELEKALYAFETGEPVVFEMGAASRIQSIIPDFNKALGWYSDYKPKDVDQGDLEPVKIDYRDYMSKTKEKVQYLMEHGQANLIGKNLDVPELKQLS